MPDFASEADAENFLIGAVVGDADNMANTEISQSEDLDRQDDETADTEQRAEGETEQEEKPQAKATQAKEPAEPDEDEIEIPGEDGQEPTRVKVADVVRKAQEYDRFENHKAQIVEQIERQALEHVTPRLQAIENAGQQTAYMIQAALQLLGQPQPPNTDMLNPASQNYNPDQYHMAFAQYQRASQQHQQARGLGEQLMQQAQTAVAQAKEAREGQELQRLQRAWPEFGQQDTLDRFVADMGKAYGFSAQELDEVLVDHRQALVARDALAYRAMKAQSGDVKAKVEAKAPKLVRSKTEAKATPAQQRDGQGRYASDALTRLRKTNSDADAAAFFTGLVKANRI